MVCMGPRAGMTAVGEPVVHMMQDGQALVRHGEIGTNFFVIRYGKVKVMRPGPDGSRIEVCILRRGQLVGERTMITGALHAQDRLSAKQQCVLLSLTHLDQPASGQG